VSIIDTLPSLKPITTNFAFGAIADDVTFFVIVSEEEEPGEDAEELEGCGKRRGESPPR